jgi:peptidoglycan/LPS O-acetylase OafA/YrhL
MRDAPIAPPRGHLPALDGLRGIAILLVLMHALDVVQPQGGATRALDYALNAGWIGVQLFFVLSGFLITGILLDTRGTARYYRSFFVRRVLRIFPLYFGVLLVAFVVLPNVMSLPPGYGAHQVWLWTFLENYAAPFGGGEAAFPHFWSLCVEEQFYLLWPLLVALCGRRGIVAMSSLLIVVSIFARLYVRQHFGEPVGPDAVYVFTPCRMDALALGALAAALVREPRTAAWILARAAPGWFVAGTLIVLAALALGRLQRTGAEMQALGYGLLAMGFAAQLLGSLRGNTVPATLLSMPWLRRVGRYSYAMYVFHAPLHLYVGLPLLARLDPAPGPWDALLYLVSMSLLTFLAGALSWHAYERRFLALKPRLAPQPAS